MNRQRAYRASAVKDAAIQPQPPVTWLHAGPALALAIVAGLAADNAFAQQAFDKSLDGWNYDQLYQGWSAESMLDDAEVYGQDGEEIGDVRNLLLSEQGQIVALIAEVGGFWDIGDTHIAVPWDQARFDNERITIPVTEDNLDSYDLFETAYFTRADVGATTEVDDDFDTGPRIWKATELMHDYTVLESGEGHGYINDLVFDDDGQLMSLLVNVSYGTQRGYYGYPWVGPGYDGYAWNPGMDHYTLPYSVDEIGDFNMELDVDQIHAAPLMTR